MYSVIGGSGFIGTRLCSLLADRGVDFEIIDIKESRSFPDRCKICDIRDLELLRETLAGDTIINLAAVHRDDVRDRSQYYTTNVDGTRNLCTVAGEKGIDHFVFTSTVAVYGFCDPDTDETGELDPFNDYGKSKLQAEEVLNAWFEEGPERRALNIVRPTVVFGEGNRGNVFNLINQIAGGRFVMVGNGRNRKSMAYVGNIAAFLAYSAGEKAPGRVLTNYVDKPDFTMNALVALVRSKLGQGEGTGFRLPYPVGLGLGYIADVVARVTGRTLPVSSIRVRKFCATTAFSSAAHDRVGFSAPFALQDGLERTLTSEFINPDPEREIFFTE